MSLFRSEEMKLYSLTFEKDFAWHVMETLGQLSCLHFLDLNEGEPVFNRTYASIIRRCDDSSRRIHYFESLCKELSIPVIPPRTPEAFLQNMKDIISQGGRDSMACFEDIEQKLKAAEEFLLEQRKTGANAHDKYIEIIEHRCVIEKSMEIIQRKQQEAAAGKPMPLPPGKEEKEEEKREYVKSPSALQIEPQSARKLFSEMLGVKFTYLAGLIPKEESLRFSKLVFRRSRGNCVTILENLANPIMSYEGKPQEKTLYLLIFRESEILNLALQKVCDSFGSSRYNITPDSILEQEKLVEEEKVYKSMKETTQNAIKNKLDEINMMYHNIAGSSIATFKLFFEKERLLYSTLNMFKVELNLYKGLCWCPVNEKATIDQELVKLRETQKVICGNLSEVTDHDLTPPTNFRTNEFLKPFQMIVETYGTPSYQEANPTLFTIITFPFLFGVMFGDFCHGLVLLSLFTYVCFRKDYLIKTDNLLAALVDYRYMLLLMAVFSTFSGFLYNDFAAVPLVLMPSCYDAYTSENSTEITRSDPNCVYPIGFDPRWLASTNELSFVNSFKMKLSVIVGVIHMLVGVVCKGLNALHYKKAIDFWFEFIPQFIFLAGFFGFMVFMIMFKWSVDWSYVNQNGPSIITLLINIPLKGGDPGDVSLFGPDGRNIQIGLNKLILWLSIICVPWMLIAKPYILKYLHQKEAAEEESARNLEMKPIAGAEDHHEAIPYVKMEDKKEEDGKEEKKEEVVPEHKGKKDILHPGKEKFDMGELMIHQIIETIEYVLGCISNTASYLRLWALSLAHAQLSKVFYDMTLGGVIKSNGNFFSMFIMYVYLAFTTFGVLMCMDILECFLHALRLHWVEFQSKFFKAAGYKFCPFDFREIGKKK